MKSSYSVSFPFDVLRAEMRKLRTGEEAAYIQLIIDYLNNVCISEYTSPKFWEQMIQRIQVCVFSPCPYLSVATLDPWLKKSTIMMFVGITSEKIFCFRVYKQC